MRACLLLLAVLATFKTIVQVASTEAEDISSKFITAISPNFTAHNQSASRDSSSLIVRSELTLSQAAISAATSDPVNIGTTAISRAFSFSAADFNNTALSTLSAMSPASALRYDSHTSDESVKISESSSSTENITIDIKQFEENDKTAVLNDHIGGSNNRESKPGRYVVSQVEPLRTQQLANAQSNQNQNSNKRTSHKHSEQATIEQLSAVQVHPQVDQITIPAFEQQQQQQQSSSSSSSSALAERQANLIVSNSGPNRTKQKKPNWVEDDEEEEPATYSKKEIIAEKVTPDPSTLVEIENSLLSLFNMKRPPKIDRSKIVIPEAMKQLYVQIMGHELDSVNIPRPGMLTKSANTVRSFTHQDSKIDDRFPHHYRFRLYFDIGSIPTDEKLKAAELQLTRDISLAALHPRQANRTRYQVLVYDITRVGVRGKREPNYFLLDTKTVRLNSTLTVSLDVQPAVDRWLATPKKNFGLLVEVRTMRSLKPAPHHHVRLRRSADEPHDDWKYRQPLLFTYTDDGRHKSRSIRDVSARSKRAGHRRPHRRKNTEENCRRHSLYVDFADVGWSDWIVAPPGYDAFYCHGKCPFPLAEHLNSTNHAVVQTLVNNLTPGKVPKACCVPTQLEGIAMLYLNDQRTVVLKNYQDMTVVGCGCR